MADLPDVYSWIKLIYQPTGKVIASGTELDDSSPGGVTIRYVVANDSNKPTGNIVVTCALRKNGNKLPNPVSSAQIQLASKQIWKHEHSVSHPQGDLAEYVASMLGDIGNLVNEEDEKNNKAMANFGFTVTPK